MFLFSLYLILSPVVWTLFRIAMTLFHKKGRERFLLEYPILRKALYTFRKECKEKECIVFHAASGGEFEQLKPLLPKVNRKKYYIVQTFYSATIYRKEKNSTLFDVCLYHPLDSFVSAFLFFKSFKPKMYIVNRHDVWPVFLFVARLCKVKTVIINTNVHEKSGRNFFLFRAFNRYAYSLFDEIYTGSERLKQNIQELSPATQPVITGDTRFEQVKLRADRNKYDHFDFDCKDRSNIVLGSIIPSDYAVVFGGIRKSWGEQTATSLGIRVIAVPHEVDKKDIDELIVVLEKYNFSYSLYSDKPDPNSDVLIVNTVGMLAELYGYGDFAYVGAGFGAGVHSVIEPAVYGIPVAYGPNISLLDEAVVMAEKGIGTVVCKDDDFKVFITMDETKYRDISSKSDQYCTASLTSSETLVQALNLA